MKYKLESKLPGEISITSYMQMTPPFMPESKELKSLLMKVREESEKTDLKLNIQKTIMANRRRNNGNGETLFLEASKSLQMVTAAMK